MSIDPARLQRTLHLFDAALEQPAATRAAWLAQQCGDDAELRRDVEAMLAADAGEDNDPITPKLASLREDGADHPANQRGLASGEGDRRTSDDRRQ